MNPRLSSTTGCQNRVRGRRFTSRRGIAAIEMVVLLPFYFLMFCVTLYLGDMMYIQQKSEVAARYVGWKHKSPSDVHSTFLHGRGEASANAPHSHKDDWDGHSYVESSTQAISTFADDVASKSFGSGSDWVKDQEADVKIHYVIQLWGLSHPTVGGVCRVLKGTYPSTCIPPIVSAVNMGLPSIGFTAGHLAGFFGYRDSEVLNPDDMTGLSAALSKYKFKIDDELVARGKKEMSSLDAKMLEQADPSNPGN